MTDLPSSWIAAPIVDVCELIQDCEHRTPEYSDVGIPALRPRDVVGGRLNLDGAARVPPSEYELQTRRYAPQPGDIAYSRELSLGWAVKLPADAICLSQGMVAVRPGKALLADYLVHFLNGPGRVHAVAAQAGSAHPHLNLRDIRAFTTPLAPLEEQERIVTAIEEAFSKLDAGEAGLRTVRRRLKRMREAVLAAAVTGRLVPQDPTDTPAAKLVTDLGAESIAANDLGALPALWTWASLGDVSAIGSGIQKQPKRTPNVNVIPFLRVANVGRGTLDLADVHTIEVFDGELDRYGLRRGDLLVVEGNGSPSQIGRSATWHGEIEPCVHQNHLIRVRPSPILRPAYLELYWNSPDASRRVQAVASSTSGLHTLSTGKLKALPVAIPPIEEQGGIVAEVARQFSFIEACERAVDAGVARAAALRRSVLKTAFEGRLVPQDPSDEPASALLDRIREERSARSVTTKPLGRRRVVS